MRNSPEPVDGPDRLLDRRGVHVHPADHDHVVGAAHDAAGEPAAVVAGGAALVAVHDDVAGAVAQHREAGAVQRREHELAALAGRGRLQVLVEDLADELVLVHVQAVPLGARGAERARLGEPGVVDAPGPEALLDARPHGGQRGAGLAGAEHELGRTRAPPRAAARPPPRAAAARRWACTRSPSRSTSAIVCSRCTDVMPPSATPSAPTSWSPSFAAQNWMWGPKRVGERHAVARPRCRRRSSVWAKQRAPPAPSPPPVSSTRSGRPVVPLVWCMCV